MKRDATAVWKGSGKEGRGYISTANKVLDQAGYSWQSRYEQGEGTNPEELLAAAHAGCFTMKLSFVIGESGVKPEELTTTCEITLENNVISSSYLKVKGKVPGMTKEDFEKAVQNAATNCPVSKMFRAEIKAEGTLI